MSLTEEQRERAAERWVSLVRWARFWRYFDLQRTQSHRTRPAELAEAAWVAAALRAGASYAHGRLAFKLTDHNHPAAR